jgi:hypothetical protein
MRRNGETQRAHGSGKSYPKETNSPNSWMSLRNYAMISMRTFLPRTPTRMTLSTGALLCLTKVSTSPRRSMHTVGWQRALRRMCSSLTSPKPSNPQRGCTSCFHATRQRTRLSPRESQANVQARCIQRAIRLSRQPRRGAQLDKLQTSLYALKSLLTAIFSMPKHRLQISKLLIWLKKPHVSDGRPAPILFLRLQGSRIP